MSNRKACTSPLLPPAPPPTPSTASDTAESPLPSITFDSKRSLYGINERHRGAVRPTVSGASGAAPEQARGRSTVKKELAVGNNVRGAAAGLARILEKEEPKCTLRRA